MSAKTDSLGIVSRLIGEGPIGGLDQSIAPVPPSRAVLCEALVPSPKPPLWLELSSAEHRAAEFWETLSYVAIWLCGLSSIGVCFL